MARDYLIFLQANDLRWVHENRSTVLDAHQNVCFCPDILEYALRRNITNFEYRESNLLVGERSLRHANYCDFKSLTLDYELSRIREEIFGIENAAGWEYLNFRFVFWRLTWFQMLAKYIRQVFEPGRLIRVVASRGPQDFLSDSGMPARTLVSELGTLGARAEHFEIDYLSAGEKLKTARLLVPDPDFLRDRYPHSDALVHIPTCFHDKPIFREKIARRWPNALDIASPFWDVPLTENPETRVRLRLYPVDHPVRRDRKIVEYETAYREHLVNHFRELLPKEAMDEQVGQFVSGASSQAIWFLGLQNLSAEFPNKKTSLVISDHDGGLCGPLWSWSRSSDMDVHVLPHSASQNIRLPANRNVTAYADCQFQYPAYSMESKEVTTKYVTLRTASRNNQRPAREVRTIGLVTALFSWAGVQAESSSEFIRFYKALNNIAAASGLTIQVRFKPDHSALLFCERALGIPSDTLAMWTRKPLEDFAAECQLALLCGEPTTAAAIFISLGIPTIYVKYANNNRVWAAETAKGLPSSLPILEERDALDLVRRSILERGSTLSNFGGDIGRIESESIDWFT